jgi:hypothetical protein
VRESLERQKDIGSIEKKKEGEEPYQGNSGTASSQYLSKPEAHLCPGDHRFDREYPG